MDEYLSFIMGNKDISEEALINLGIIIIDKTSEGFLKIKIPIEKLSAYIDLIKDKMANGFWNEVIGKDQIIFVFKFKDGQIKEVRLSEKTETEIAKLCMELNNEPAGKTDNVYKYLSENSFYYDFMIENYSNLINRN